MSKKWWKNLMALILSVCLTFPLCFSAVRYLPPLFHHPVWFPGEWSERRVHSWDPWDSEKYIELDEYVDAAVGRIVVSIKNVMQHSPFVLKVDAEELQPADSEPVLTREEGSDGFIVRITIYKYYFDHLNFWGHSYEEQGFFLIENYWIYHAHNIFLQYGTDFGIPVMILFIVLIFWGASLLGRQYKQQKSVSAAACWMFLLIPAVFGLFEYSGGTGSLSILMMFVAWREVICYEKK